MTMKLTDLLLNLLFPPKCVSCGDVIRYDSTEALCKICRSKYEIEKGFFCPECNVVHADCLCMPKALEKYATEALHLVEYVKEDSPARDMILFAKDQDYEYLNRFLTSEIACLFERRDISLDGALVTYVPRSRKKQIKHGVDQAREVAKRLAKRYECEFASLFLHKDSDEQKHLSAESRKVNTQGAYSLKEKQRSAVKGKHIILYDDVITTGATLLACASLLKKAGASGITVVTFGKTYRTEKKDKNPVLKQKGNRYGR